MITAQNVEPILQNILHEAAIDTETTGLHSFKDDYLFSIIISDANDNHYFNFKDYPAENIQGIPRSYIHFFKDMLADPNRVWFLQNAKFDMHMLAREGLKIEGRIYDLMFLDRIHFNQHKSYRLKDITKRWGDFKDDGVWNYIEENKLKTKIEYPEYNKEIDQPHFDQVPYSIMEPYGKQDGSGTLNVGKKILTAILDSDMDLLPGIPRQAQVIENESKLVHTLFKMEQRGIQLDLAYCKEALEHYRVIVKKVETQFKQMTGLDFVKGTTVFEEVFASEKDKWEKTDKGAWSWDKHTLKTFENPVAPLVIEYSEAKKQFEYFANFLFYADANGILHADFQQSGTVTSRLSCRDPNLQNLTNPDKYEKEKETALYPVRRAFVPREGFFFAMPDYSQVEFRILLDIAKANALINEVLAGHDVHTATANLAKVSRKHAKTVNFLTVYGGGVVKLAMDLFETKGSKHQLGAIYKEMFKWRMSEDEKAALPTLTKELRAHNTPLIKQAYDIQQSIFRAAPEIKDTLKAIQRTAEQRGYVRNWLGRRYYFTEKKWAYKAPNHLVQGGAAEVIKIAMNRVEEYLKDKESRLLLSIHDELILEIRFGEEYVVEEVKRIMESVYPYKRLPLPVDIEYSYKNLADKEPWPPHGKETGNDIQREVRQEVRENTEVMV
jgi:DNA polymerase-1